jgi:hypothetical protein
MYYRIFTLSTQKKFRRMAVSQKISQNFFCLIVLFLLLTLLFSSPVFAQNEEALIIEIYDTNNWNESVGTTLFEKRSYDITVSTENESILLGVTITFLGTTYNTTTEQPFITFISPSFDKSDTFNISATKEGYLSDNIDVIVMIGELFIASHPSTVEEKKEFQVTVTNQSHLPVENALVYLTSESEAVPTNAQGIATVVAPAVDIDSSVTIQVIKSGYQPDSATIRVEHVQGFILAISYDELLQLLPLLVAVLVVIFAIVIVSWRKRKGKTDLQPHSRIRHAHEPPPDMLEKPYRKTPAESAIYSVNGKRDIPVTTSDSRVEEIRIPVQERKKETTYISEEKEPPRTSVNHKNQQDEWFKGQDYMRYKIDELTGKIDTTTDGKWFEGERDIKYKVDEALKKNVKKKKEEEDIIK